MRPDHRAATAVEVARAAQRVAPEHGGRDSRIRALTTTPSRLSVSASTAGDVCLLTAAGTLDTSTYLELRGRVIKAALDQPPAVLVDVGQLEVPAPSAWSVFTSARWHVSIWPGVPIALVCPRSEVAEQIEQTGVTRYVSVHPDVETALRSVEVASRSAGGRAHPLGRARAELPHQLSSLRHSRDFVARWLSSWSQDHLIPTAKVIVDVLVDNVLRHTESSPVVLLENTDSTVTIAVEDTDGAPALLREPIEGCLDRTSGLAVVGALCRDWGSTPTPSGKTVWAVIRPENRL